MRPETYRHTATLLAERCRVIVPSLFALPGPWRYPDVLAIFTATLEQLEIDRVTMIGHSFGGGIELGFAARHPKRVEALVFADTLAVSREWVLASEALRHPLGLRAMATKKATSAFVDNLVRHPRQLVGAAWWAFTSGRSEDISKIAAARVPAHVLWANRDTILSRSDGETFARELEASFTVVNAPGEQVIDHDWMFEHPDLFVEHLDLLGLAALAPAGPS
jgi:pimeloyl-ACP methyl ester carboxylesterase